MLIFLKNKKLFYTLSILIIMFFFTSCSTNSSNTISNINKNAKEEIGKEFKSYDMGISSGSSSGVSFGTSEYALNRSNGKYIIFWAKNTGKVNVKISINNYSKELTLEPDEEGYISEEFSKDEQNFTFKAVPTPNGGNISIDYKITQSKTNK